MASSPPFRNHILRSSTPYDDGGLELLSRWVAAILTRLEHAILPSIMLDPAELQRRQQEDEEFRHELEKRQQRIQERAGYWQGWVFGVSWLLAMSGWGILATREHGPRIAFGVILAILLGAGFVYAEAERMVTSLVSDDIQDEIERRGREKG